MKSKDFKAENGPMAFCRSASEQHRENYSLEITVRQNLRIRSLTGGLTILLASCGKTPSLDWRCQNLLGCCELSQDNEARVPDYRRKSVPDINLVNPIVVWGICLTACPLGISMRQCQALKSVLKLAAQSPSLDSALNFLTLLEAIPEALRRQDMLA